MIILELVLYGVRNFTEIKKFSLRPGLNLIHGGNGTGKTTVADTLFAILTCEKHKATLQSLAPLNQKELCQVALIFQSQDGGIYRLVRDLAKDIGSLSKMDQNKKFNLISKDDAQIVGFLQSEIRALSPGQMRSELLLTYSQMPSASPITPPDSNLISPIEDQEQSADRTSLQSKTKRLEEIQAALALADQVAKFEEQLDELQNRLLELKRIRERHKSHTQEINLLLEKQADYAGFDGLPKNIISLLDEYEINEKKHTQEFTELEEQKIELDAQAVLFPATPIFLNPLFLTGIGVMVFSLIFAIIVRLEGVWQIIYFLGLLTGAGMVMSSVILDVRRLAQRKSIQNKLDAVSKAQETSEARFKKQNAVVLDLLKKTSCQNVDQLKDRMRNYTENLRSVENLKEEQQRLLGGKLLLDLDREQQSLSVAAKEIESKIRGAQGSSADIYTLQEEMRMIQREMKEQQNIKPQAVAGTGEVAHQTALHEKGSSVQRLLQSKPFEALPKKQIDIRATAWLQRLTRGRYDCLEYDSFSNLNLIDKNGLSVPFEQLSSGVKDQVYLSLLWASWQLTSIGIPSSPLILDDPFLGLDEFNRKVAVEALKELGQNRQIILLTTASHPDKDNLNFIELESWSA